MSLSAVIGQDKSINKLKQQVTGSQMPHAYIFYGQDGVGKRKTSVELAKLVNCLGSNTMFADSTDACDNCVSCSKIDRSIHPDVHMIDFDWQMKMLEEKNPATRIKIDTIRLMQKEMSLRPFEGKYRVFIIPESEKLNIESSNCLLKTLEEPPPFSLIILITSSLGTLPKTILSRCQKIRFDVLTDSTIKTIVPAATDAVIKLANGSAGRAVRLQDTADELKFVEETWQSLKTGKLNPAELSLALSGLARNKDKTRDFVINLLYMARNEMVTSTKPGIYDKMVESILAYKSVLRTNVSLDMLLQTMFLELTNITETNVCSTNEKRPICQ
jgi:DNA polymerase-3 subunit delta'